MAEYLIEAEQPAAENSDEFSTLTGDIWDLATDSSKKDIALTAGRTLTIQNYPASFVGMLHVTANNSHSLLINSEDITAKIRTTGETMLGVVKTRLGLRYYPDGGVGGAGGGETGTATYESQANAYFSKLETVGAVLTQAEKDAVLAFGQSLHNAGIYNDLAEVWLMLGGTAASTRIGLKSVADLNFQGALTYSTSGVDTTVAGAGAALIPISPASILQINDFHLSVYSREHTIDPGNAGTDDIGAQEALNQIVRFMIQDNNSGAGFADLGNYEQRVTFACPDSRGLFTATRPNSSLGRVYRNGILQGENTAANTGTMPAINFALFALNHLPDGVKNFSGRAQSFASMGKARTAAQETTFYNAVQTLQTAFNRAIV